VKDSAPNCFVDTGPIVALFAQRDQWHHWAVETFAAIAEPLWTSEVVVAEVAWNLGENSPATLELLNFVHRGELCVLPCVTDHAGRLAQLMAKFERMDICDGSLVVLSESFPKARIITLDRRDFSVYRRFGREALPLIMPD